MAQGHHIMTIYYHWIRVVLIVSTISFNIDKSYAKALKKEVAAPA